MKSNHSIQECCLKNDWSFSLRFDITLTSCWMRPDNILSTTILHELILQIFSQEEHFLLVTASVSLTGTAYESGVSTREISRFLLSRCNSIWYVAVVKLWDEINKTVSSCKYLLYLNCCLFINNQLHISINGNIVRWCIYILNKASNY